MAAGARAEWAPLRRVLVHPPGIEVFFALLSPYAHLYERFFDRAEAEREHRQLCELLRHSFGVQVHLLRDTIETGAIRDPELMQSLVALAERRLGRTCEGDACMLPEVERRELEEPLPLRMRDPVHLVEIVLLNPTILLTPSGVQTLLRAPLFNLYFMRDQQAATDRGIVMGRMKGRGRGEETALCRLALKSLGIEPVHLVEQGWFEGGDLIPAGDLAFLGHGARTDRTGAQEVMEHSMSADEIALVHQPVHPLVNGHDPMISMHLDTYFNIPAEGIAIGNPLLLREAQVEVYHREGDGYRQAQGVQSLDRYLKEKGFETIGITTLEQLCYAANLLCIRDGECLSPDTHAIAPLVIERLREKERLHPGRYSALLRQAETDFRRLKADAEFFPHKKEVFAHGLEMTPLRLQNATGGYGGAHCMTCVLERG